VGEGAKGYERGSPVHHDRGPVGGVTGSQGKPDRRELRKNVSPRSGRYGPRRAPWSPSAAATAPMMLKSMADEPVIVCCGGRSKRPQPVAPTTRVALTRRPNE
jgi:hypothetical protein